MFQALSPEDYRRVMKLVETAILSTDLAMYFKKRNKFLELVDNGEFDWQSDDKKDRKYLLSKIFYDVEIHISRYSKTLRRNFGKFSLIS